MKNRILYSLSIVLFAITALCEGVFLYQIFNDDGNINAKESVSDFWNNAGSDREVLPENLADLIPELQTVGEVSFNPYLCAQFANTVGFNNVSGTDLVYFCKPNTTMGGIIVITSRNVIDFSRPYDPPMKKLVLPDDPSDMFSGCSKLRVVDFTGLYDEGGSASAAVAGLSLGKLVYPFNGSEFMVEFPGGRGMDDYYDYNPAAVSGDFYDIKDKMDQLGYQYLADLIHEVDTYFNTDQINQIYFNRSDVAEKFGAEEIGEGIYISHGYGSFIVCDIYDESMYTLDESGGEGIQLFFMGDWRPTSLVYYSSELTGLRYLDMSGAYVVGDSDAGALVSMVTNLPTVSSGQYSEIVNPTFIVDDQDSFGGCIASGTTINTGIHNSRVGGFNEDGGGGSGGGGGGTTTKVKVHVTLDNDGGSGGTTDIWYYYKEYGYYDDSSCSSAYQISSVTVPTKTNFLFGGYKASDGTVYVDSNGSFINSLYSNVNSSITLTAVWVTSKVITITLDYNHTLPGEALLPTEEVYYKYHINKFYSDINCTNSISSVLAPWSHTDDFEGYYDSTGTKRYIDSYGTISPNLCFLGSNTTLHGKWKPGKINITVTVKTSESLNWTSSTFTNSTNGMLRGTMIYSVCPSDGGSPVSRSSTTRFDGVAYEYARGYTFKIQVTAKSDYLFLGYTTSETLPQNTTKPSTTLSKTVNSSTTFYLWFTKSSANRLKYDSTAKYWYFEDGKTLQSYVGTSMNATLNSNIDLTTNYIGETIQYAKAGKSYSIKLYSYNNEIYGALTAPKNMTLNLSGTSCSFVQGSSYWFKYEPIRWRVTDYGVSSTSYPTGWDKYGSNNKDFLYVSDKIVYVTQMRDSDFGVGMGYPNTFPYYNGGMDGRVNENTFNYLTTLRAEYTIFSDASSGSVSTTTAENMRVRVASVNELTQHYSDLRSTATDYVAFMLGINTNQYCNYFTRDVGTRYYNLTGIGVDGRKHDYYSNQFMGTRLAMNFSEGSYY